MNPLASIPDPASSVPATASLPMRPLSESLPITLLRAREATMRLFRPMLADYGLTEQQWRVLRALTAATEALEVGELAERAVLWPPSLSRILAKLDNDGLIQRNLHDTDQRRWLIALSAEGAALVSTIAPESERRYNAIEAEYGSERLRRLLIELHDLAQLETNLDDDQEVVP